MAGMQPELGELLEAQCLVESQGEEAEGSPQERARPLRRTAAYLAAAAVAAAAALALAASLSPRWAARTTGLEVVELDAAVPYDARLVAYRDAGQCGRIDDRNVEWCGFGKELLCKPCVHVEKSVCRSGQAYLVKQHGGSAKHDDAKDLTIGGCNYMYLAVYNCLPGHRSLPVDEARLVKPSMRCSPEEPLLYVGVETTPREFQHRVRARRDWMRTIKRNPALRSCVKFEFIVGHYPVSWVYAKVERKLRREAKRYQDIRQLPMLDNYVSRPDKTLYLMEEGLRRNARFIIRIDSDQRLFVRKTFHLARSLRATDNVYAAATRMDDPDRDSLLGDLGEFVRHLSSGAWMMSRALVRQVTEADNVHTMSYATYSAGVENLAVEQWVRYASKTKRVKFVQVTLNGPLALGGSTCE